MTLQAVIDEIKLKLGAASGLGIKLELNNRDLTTLRGNLENVQKTFEEEDKYYLNEKTAQKLNIYLHNNSSEFLEDSSIEILIPYPLCILNNTNF